MKYTAVLIISFFALTATLYFLQTHFAFIFPYLERFFLAYFLLVISFSALKILLSIWPVLGRKKTRLADFDHLLGGTTELPPITIVIPAYNEEFTVIESVQSLLKNTYPQLTIMVVNDGSRDKTLELLIDSFNFKPEQLALAHPNVKSKPIIKTYQSHANNNLWLIDKEAGGSKADANNAALRYCQDPLVCYTDADTIIEKNTFFRLIEPFLFLKDDVWATGGAVLLKNHCVIKDHQISANKLPKSHLACFQTLEYLRSFLYGRMGLNSLGGNFIVSGAFGLFLTEAVVNVNGHNSKAIGEDIDLVMRLHRHQVNRSKKAKILYLPDPICYTEAPEDFSTLKNQRDRWQRGLMYSLQKHREIFLNPQYQAKGFIIFPYYLSVEMLSPIVEFIAYAMLSALILKGSINYPFAILFFSAAYLSGLMVSWHALMLDAFSFDFFRGKRLRVTLFFYALFENIGYHQLIVYYRLVGILKYLHDLVRRQESGWGEMKRLSKND